jgi:hypothetical protein
MANKLKKGTVRLYNFVVDIVDFNLIENGVEVYARVFRDGKQIGFGKNGDVDIEKFRIIEPDTSFEGKEDQLNAIVLDIIRASNHKPSSDNIKPNKVGRTTTIQPSSKDSWLRSNQATTNFGGNANMQVGNLGSSAIETGRALVAFDVQANIPSGDTVTDATLSLYKFASNYAGVTSIYRLFRNWIEAQVTWNVWSTGNNWSTAGAGDTTNDRSSTVSATTNTPSNDTGEFLDYTGAQLINDVQGMLDGTFDQNGWLFISDGEGVIGSRRQEYRTKEHGTAGERPKLIIEHESSFSPQTARRLLLMDL